MPFAEKYLQKANLRIFLEERVCKRYEYIDLPTCLQKAMNRGQARVVGLQLDISESITKKGNA